MNLYTHTISIQFTNSDVYGFQISGECLTNLFCTKEMPFTAETFYEFVSQNGRVICEGFVNRTEPYMSAKVLYFEIYNNELVCTTFWCYGEWTPGWLVIPINLQNGMTFSDKCRAA